MALALKQRDSRVPAFVVLEDNFGWMENGVLMNFTAGQVVHDQSIIRMLMSRNAPLLTQQKVSSNG